MSFTHRGSFSEKPIVLMSNVRIDQLTRIFAEQFNLADGLLTKAKKDLIDCRNAYIIADANYKEAQKKLNDARRTIYNLQLEFDTSLMKAKSTDDSNTSERIRRVVKSRYRSKSCGKSVSKK